VNSSAGSATGPLRGIRILDLTSVVLGPFATRILGDYGADIIKVEGTDGDVMRANGTSRHAGMSSIFLSINRNKRSLAIDLKTPEGREICLRLASQVDLVVHNMRVSAIERLGLGYDAVRAVNPSVVYCAATGFEQAGPHRSKPAFDDIIQATCGLASLMGEVGAEPAFVPTLVADKTAGMALVNAVLAALLHREREGSGQYVEVPMLETMVDFTMAEHMGGLGFEPPLGDAGYARILRRGRRPVRTRDGHISMLPYSPSQWMCLFQRVDHRDLLSAYDLSDRHKLNACLSDLYRELESIAPSRSTREWVDICDELDIPAAAIHNLRDLPDHPQLSAVNLFQPIEHPTEGSLRMIRPTTLFSQTPASVRRHAPSLGEHSIEILQTLGLDNAKIDELVQRGVVGMATPSATPSDERQE
jgi:crotonobetainyl-CoA:carnitine CoA-transferase CaiB-like acyl-CoA transferase